MRNPEIESAVKRVHLVGNVTIDILFEDHVAAHALGRRSPAPL